MAHQNRKVTLILASASPRRRALLKEAGFRFQVMPSHVSERSSLREPRRLVVELALRKAKATARLLQSGWVLGADTVVAQGGKILGKPRDERHAYQMLYRLSGTTHRVYTGIALVDAATGKSWKACEMSIVRMKKLSIDLLLKLAHKHHDKAGAYAIQEKRDPIAQVIRGSYDNVVGLPVKAVKALLKKPRPTA